MGGCLGGRLLQAEGRGVKTGRVEGVAEALQRVSARLRLRAPMTSVAMACVMRKGALHVPPSSAGGRSST